MSETELAVALTAEQRSALAAFGDALIPGGAGLPCASEADVHGKWADRVLLIRPDLAEPLSAALSEEGGQEAVLQRLNSERPQALEALRFVVAAAYFMNPRIRKLLGYPGRGPKANPAYPDEAEHYLEGGLLDVVRERGPIYRPTPGPTPAG